MKKLLIYALLLGVVLLLPMQGTDVGKLLPVELVCVYTEADTVKIVTELGEMGTGATVAEAIDNLKATTAGVVFLDTADYVLIDEASKGKLESIKQHLKPSARICILSADADLKAAAQFLSVHKPQLRLKDSTEDSKMEILTSENGRFMLKKD